MFLHTCNYRHILCVKIAHMPRGLLGFVGTLVLSKMIPAYLPACLLTVMYLFIYNLSVIFLVYCDMNKINSIQYLPTYLSQGGRLPGVDSQWNWFPMLIYGCVKCTQCKGIVCDKFIPLFCVNLSCHMKNIPLFFFLRPKTLHFPSFFLKVHEKV